MITQGLRMLIGHHEHDIKMLGRTVHESQGFLDCSKSNTS